jgi:catechol 2,3-dioxygenase-like lactoylglutathione lyase family enzyme
MITRMSHIGIEVQDIDEAVQFYKTMGFQLTLRFEKPEPKANAAHLVSPDGSMVELWQFLDKSHPQVEFIKRHIAVESNSLEADLDTFVKQGCQIVIPITKGVTMTYAFIRDVDGNYIEVTQK